MSGLLFQGVAGVTEEPFPQGLKPDPMFGPVCGTTKVVPFQNVSVPELSLIPVPCSLFPAFTGG